MKLGSKTFETLIEIVKLEIMKLEIVNLELENWPKVWIFPCPVLWEVEPCIHL